METVSTTIVVPVGTEGKPFSIIVKGSDFSGKTVTGRFRKPDGTVITCSTTVNAGDPSKIDLVLPSEAFTTTGNGALVVWVDDGAGHIEPTHPPIEFRIEETVPRT